MFLLFRFQVNHDNDSNEVKPVPTPRTKRKIETNNKMRPHGGHWSPNHLQNGGLPRSSPAGYGGDVHNTSQDSGLGPSPFYLQNGLPRSSPSAGYGVDTTPPPLPPKKGNSNVFTPTLMVKTPSYGNYYNAPESTSLNQPPSNQIQCIRTQDFIPVSSSPHSR